MYHPLRHYQAQRTLSYDQNTMQDRMTLNNQHSIVCVSDILSSVILIVTFFVPGRERYMT